MNNLPYWDQVKIQIVLYSVSNHSKIMLSHFGTILQNFYKFWIPKYNVFFLPIPCWQLCPNAVVEAGGPNTSAEGSDLVGHSSSSSEEITEDTYVENANRDLTSSTNSDATKVDALEDYANVSLYLSSDIIQPIRLAGSFRCWFIKKYCWLVCVREK